MQIYLQQIYTSTDDAVKFQTLGERNNEIDFEKSNFYCSKVQCVVANYVQLQHYFVLVVSSNKHWNGDAALIWCSPYW